MTETTDIKQQLKQYKIPQTLEDDGYNLSKIN